MLPLDDALRKTVRKEVEKDGGELTQCSGSRVDALRRYDSGVV